MNRLTALWKKDPGLVVSGGAHLAVLVFLLANFSRAPVIDDTQEAVAVEMVTTSELNQVMKGEETAKPLPTPQRRVDKVAALEENNPAPPLAEARKDTPPPPAPGKPNDDPGPDTKPPEAAAAPPPPAPPERPADPAPPVPTPPPMPPVQPPEAAAPPTPPERPVEAAAPPPAPTPPPRPEPVKPPPPPEAEAIEPTPPPRPKVEPPKVEPPKVQEAKEPPKEQPKDQPKPPPRPEPRKVAKPVPVPHPREVKEAKVAPPPPPRPEPPKPLPTPPKPAKPDPSALDRVAQLLDTLKPNLLKSDPPTPSRAPSDKAPPDKVAAKQRSGNESREPARDTFDPSKISALLDHDAPQHKASTGRALTQVASLGAPSGHAEKMSPSMMAQLDGWMIDHYRGCWSYFGLGATQDYVPEVRVRLAPDGSLVGQPALLNPPRDPNLKSLADSAVRAVNRCNPMAMPERFKPFYQSWRDRTVRFDPKEMS